MNLSKPILITGCPRSGTSLTAGIIFYLGVYLGDTFIKRNKTNPTGFFENMEFGMIDTGYRDGHMNKERWTEILNKLISRYSKLDYKTLGFERWGWKAPSASEIIKDVIKVADPTIVWCRRNKKDVLSSMGEQRWMINGSEVYDNIEKNMSKVKCYEVWYEELIKNPAYEVGRLVEYLKLSPSKHKLKKAINHVLLPADNSGIAKEESYMNYV